MDSLPAEPQGSQWLNGDLSKLVHSGSQNLNLLGNRFFVDVITYITMRSYWIRKSFKSKVANVILRGEEDAETFTKGRGRSLETPRSQKRQGGVSPETLQREHGSAHTLISDFQPPESAFPSALLSHPLSSTLTAATGNLSTW